MKTKPNIVCEISERYRIETDSYNWILVKKYVKEKTGEEYWIRDKHFASLGRLLACALDMELKLCNNFEDLQSTLNQKSQELLNIGQQISAKS